MGGGGDEREPVRMYLCTLPYSVPVRRDGLKAVGGPLPLSTLNDALILQCIDQKYCCPVPMFDS